MVEFVKKVTFQEVIFRFCLLYFRSAVYLPFLKAILVFAKLDLVETNAKILELLAILELVELDNVLALSVVNMIWHFAISEFLLQ